MAEPQPVEVEGLALAAQLDRLERLAALAQGLSRPEDREALERVVTAQAIHLASVVAVVEVKP